AYENTDKPRYLQTARKLAEFALGVVLARREIFAEPPATWNYRGGNPVMNSILAAGLMHYWRATGDERVGRVCANIAYAIAYDWMSPGEPGVVLANDPLQALTMRGYNLHIIPACFWGHEPTGGERLLEAGAQIRA